MNQGSIVFADKSHNLQITAEEVPVFLLVLQQEQARRKVEPKNPEKLVDLVSD